MTQRTALLAGATGLVGRQILAGLLVDARITAVHVLARRPSDTSHFKLVHHVVDFRALPALPHVDEVYLALGTTIKVAGSQDAFRAVDYEANLSVARAARAAGARRAGLVSAMGADPHSRIFYNRVKGELESALQDVGFETLVIARPSFLHGDRKSLGQPERPGEALALKVSAALSFLIPDNYRSIAALDVAAALLREVPSRQGLHVLPSGAMQRG